ncbi:sulfotransferase [Thermodesulfobacteriota bacterium]
MYPPFNGPLFIIGMPRSGTKLLRALLNNHSQIAIPPYETEILPYWFSRWEEFGDLRNFYHFEKFYHHTAKGSFFYYMQKHRKYIPSATEWFNACKGEGTIADVFEALIRLETHATDDMIWGDKSPSYIRHIPLLKKLYPQAKIIFIVRDVRDYCLSINKAWSKNIMRAAQRWADDVSLARQNLSSIPQDSLELRFEDLLQAPKDFLREICKFLDVNFEKEMLVLTRPSEIIGDAKGHVNIVVNNKEKWRKSMPAKQVKKIEQLCRDELFYYNYPVEYKGRIKRLSSLQMKWFKILDGLNLILNNNDRQGVWHNLFFHIRYIRTSGNNIKFG